MSSGHASSLEQLPTEVVAIVVEARRAVLATIDRRGRSHVVPVGFAIVGDRIVSAVDNKPKARGRRLARLGNIEAEPRATLMFDRWDEDWTRLGWVMVRGRATIEPAGLGWAELRSRYPQYRDDNPRGEVVAVSPEDIVWWIWG